MAKTKRIFLCRRIIGRLLSIGRHNHITIIIMLYVQWEGTIDKRTSMVDLKEESEGSAEVRVMASTPKREDDGRGSPSEKGSSPR